MAIQTTGIILPVIVVCTAMLSAISRLITCFLTTGTFCQKCCCHSTDFRCIADKLITQSSTSGMEESSFPQIAVLVFIVTFNKSEDHLAIEIFLKDTFVDLKHSLCYCNIDKAV